MFSQDMIEAIGGTYASVRIDDGIHPECKVLTFRAGSKQQLETLIHYMEDTLRHMRLELVKGENL